MNAKEFEQAEYDRLAATPAGQAFLWEALPASPVPPPFPLNALPKALADMALAVSENQSTPVDLSAVTGLAVLAACACGRVTVHIREGWDMPCNLFLMPIIRSGGGKTPTFRAMGQRLFDWQFEENKQRRGQIAADAAQLEVWQAQMAKAVKAANTEEAETLSRTIANFEPTRSLKRFISGNTTPEQLIVIMEENGGAVSMLDDDGGQLLDMLAGQYTQRPNLEPFLKGFDGGTIISERRSGSQAVKSAYLTALVMLQPSAFDDMLQDNRAVGRGFLARFLFCTPEPSFEIGNEPNIPATVSAAYYETLMRLLDLPKRRFTLGQEARQCFMAWRKEATRRNGNEWAALFRYSVPPKLISSVVRIAGLFALFTDGDVTAAIMRDAISVVEYFAAHMLLAFNEVVAISLQAKETLAYVVKRGERVQQEADIKAALKRLKLFGSADAVDAALNELAKLNYIKRTRAEGQGHTAALVEIHPDLLPKVNEVIL